MYQRLLLYQKLRLGPSAFAIHRVSTSHLTDAFHIHTGAGKASNNALELDKDIQVTRNLAKLATRLL